MLTRDDLLALDRDDPLAFARERFVVPDGVVYLDGNSLGAQPASIAPAAAAVLTEWRDRMIGGWFGEGWWELPVALGAQIAGLIGADPHQVVACDTVTTNLYKTLHAALVLRPDRPVILLSDSAFPTDRYVVSAVADATGREIRLVPVGEHPADYGEKGTYSFKNDHCN